MSSKSVGLLKVNNLSVAGIGAAAIKATNLNFQNLNIPGDLSVGGVIENIETIINNDHSAQRDPFSVTSTVKGSRKIAKSPFHYPEPTGKYAVDVHNIITWSQTESCFATSKERQSTDIYNVYTSRFGEATLVNDYITPDGSGYNVPTKYGTKRLDLSKGETFYDASKQVFLTPPCPLNLTIFMPSTRDKTQEFSIYDSSATVNYYSSVSLLNGNFEQLLYDSTGLETFYSDIASDSVYNLLINYDFSGWTNSDIPAGFTTVSEIRSAQTLQRNSPSLTNRKNFINKSLNVFKIQTQALTSRQQSYLTAIKATGGYARLMSYKWNIKVHKTYTDVSGVISTNISQTQRPSGNLPIHLYEDGFEVVNPMELASRGIVAVQWMYGYVNASSRMYGNNVPFLNSSGGVKTYSYLNLTIEPAGPVTWTSRREGDGFVHYNVSNKYNVETDNPGVNNRILTSGNYCTGANSIIYNIESLRTLYNKLVSFGFSSFINFTKVSTKGYSGTAFDTIASSVIMEKYQLTFPMKFTCGFITDMSFHLPTVITDSSGVSYGANYVADYKKENVLPNGFSIPIVFCDQNHGNRSKYEDGYIGYPQDIQTVFRKTPVIIRAECIYHEFGDVHNGGVSWDDSYERSVQIYNVSLRTEGMSYPDDAYNNIIFNHNLLSLENELIMEWVRFGVAAAMYISRFSLPDYQVSKETIKEILPGTTTISPYTLDDGGGNILNAVVQETIKLPKIVKTFENSEYDFKYKLPNNFTTFVDTVDLTILNKEYTFSDVPTGYLQELIITGHELVYDSSEHLVPNSAGFNFTTSYNFDSSNNVIPITFVPNTYGANWNIKDVSGVKWFVSGNMEPIINTNSSNFSAGESVAPGHYTVITMKLKLPTNCTLGQISFDYKVSSEVAYDFIKIYNNNVLLEQLSGKQSDPNIMSDLKSFTSPIITQDDEIVIRYTKDSALTMGLDVGFVNNIVVNGADPSNLPMVPVQAGTVPKLTVKLGNSVLVDNVSVLTLNQQLFTNIYIDKTMIEPIKLKYTENICTSGYVSIYMKMLSLPNNNGKAILDV